MIQILRNGKKTNSKCPRRNSEDKLRLALFYRWCCLCTSCKSFIFLGCACCV